MTSYTILNYDVSLGSVRLSVAEMCAHILATTIEWLLPEAVLIQFVSPNDEHDVLETCREL